MLGCATQKIIEKDSGGLPWESGQWETRAYIKNLKENKNHSVDIDIFATKNNRARFEITALLGIQVASVVVSPQDISYIIYSEKSFYHGRNSGHFLEKSLGLPLNIMNLINIAFEQPIYGSDWKCTKKTGGLIDKCENISHGSTITWKDRSEGQKVVLITAPQFEMVWKFKSLKTEVQFKNEIFNLKQPEGFKAIQIN